MFSQIAVSGQIQEPRNSNILIWEILPRIAQCSQTPGFEWGNIGESQYPQLLPGEHRPKNRTGLNSQTPTENIIQPSGQPKSAHRHRPQAAPPTATPPPVRVRWAGRVADARKPHHNSATAAPAQGRGSDSVRAAGSTRQTPAATPIRQPPGRACPQPRTASRTRTQRMRSQAHQ